MKMNGHRIKKVLPGSIAEELGIEAGDRLLSIDGTRIEDIFDYQFLVQDDCIEVLLEKPDGEQWILEVEKESDEDLGVEFENALMDEYRHCQNKCVFCFIDQMPPGMRETLYFKDDDSRLSFLQGNYVTLTNMSEHDVDRICRYRLSPINISVHAMNPDLRCRMLNNRFAGEALKKLDALHQADITMNGQIVLCKGLNDGKELEYSISRLMEYLPNMQSLSVVPVGLTKYREGLYPLEAFTRKDAIAVIELITKYQEECYAKYGVHFVHASDEWYILAGMELPPEERYDGYLQLENGVGMLRLMMDEFEDCMERMKREHGFPDMPPEGRDISLATGRLAYPYIQKMAERVADACPGLRTAVYPITNHYFGEQITVAGLITGKDLLEQLKDAFLGSCLLLPETMLRSGEDVFLDDTTVSELEKTLQVPIYIVKSSGYGFVEAVLKAAEI